MKTILFNNGPNCKNSLFDPNIIDGLNLLYITLKDLIIIHISHRLKSLKNCNKIYVLNNSEVKQEGTYKTLFENK